MPDIQKQLLKFHDLIKLDFDDNKPLRDKRDLLLGDLREGLKRLFPSNTPTFDSFNQGSYDLGTGIEPIDDGDYDIDVGIVFNFSPSEKKPVDVKDWVYKALNSGARTVEIKRPCVRVQYHNNQAKHFHVDLAIYSFEEHFLCGKRLFLAKGFIGSSEDKKIWEPSEPQKLKELFKNQFSDPLDREQFRRIVRYLKRWKDYNFSSSGSARPTGIALTACCYQHFTPKKSQALFEKAVYNDLLALCSVVSKMLAMFGRDGEIVVKLPVQPYNDLFEKMSLPQKTHFKSKLQELKATLEEVDSCGQQTMACMKLRKVFGGKFPTE